MSRALLDVNVLLALLDSDHVDHDRVHDWLDSEISRGWATCPLTENGFIRIISQPRYPGPISTSEAIELLEFATNSAEHEFWPCDISALDATVIDRSRVLGPRQVTDSYLLALAASRGGRFVTFDHRVSLGAVPGASVAHLTIL